MGNTTSDLCPLLEDYDTNKFFKGNEGLERKGVVLGIQSFVGEAKELVSPQNIKDTGKKLDRLPQEFNMTLYKLFGNNINKRMPIWKSIDGAASIALLRGHGKQFLILGEIHCSKSINRRQLCLSADNPTSPAQFLADLARYTPSFLDVYTEHSEFEYWEPGGHLAGFLGEISSGPLDLYLGPGDSGKSKRGAPCMDFQWIHRQATRKAKDAWRMGVCLTSRWHYTDIRDLEQAELDKILGDDEDVTRRYLGRGRQGYDVNEGRREFRYVYRKSATLEMGLWEGFAGGTGGGKAYAAFTGLSNYNKKLNKKIGPKLFLAWTKKYFTDNSRESLIRFDLIYNDLATAYFSKSKKNAKEEAPANLRVARKERPSPLCFPLWQLAHDTGIKVLWSSTSNGTSLRAFLDLIVAYALLQNDHILAILELLVKVNAVKKSAYDDMSHSVSKKNAREKENKRYYDKLWDLMFTQSLLESSPRLKKALERTTQREAILTWARSRYEHIISRGAFTGASKYGGWEDPADYLLPHTLLAISKKTSAKLGEGVFTNQKASTFSSHYRSTTPINILTQFYHLGALFRDLSVINMDCYTIARMFKKFNVPKGVNQPEEPHTCVLYFGDDHSANVTAFLAQMPGMEFVTASNNTARIKDARPFPALGGNKSCCLKLDKFPQPLLWPVGTKHAGFPDKTSKKTKGNSCSSYRKTKVPKCDDQPGCKWVVGQGCAPDKIPK